jgi:hypothetical protein
VTKATWFFVALPSVTDVFRDHYGKSRTVIKSTRGERIRRVSPGWRVTTGGKIVEGLNTAARLVLAVTRSTTES